MKNKLFICLFVSILFLFPTTKIYAANSVKCTSISPNKVAYVTRDSFLRKNYSDKYTAGSIVNEGFRSILIKGTKVILKEKCGSYYHVKVDDVSYPNTSAMDEEFSGYVVYTSLKIATDKEKKDGTVLVKKDSKTNRSLSISDKGRLAGNVLRLYRASERYDFDIYYPTGSYITSESNKAGKELEKLDLIKMGYNFVANDKKRSSKTYYLSCSGFVNTVYRTTFNLRQNDDWYWAGSYVTRASSKKEYDSGIEKSKQRFYVVTTANENGEKLYTTKMQTGDAIVGRMKKKAGVSGDKYTLTKTECSSIEDCSCVVKQGEVTCDLPKSYVDHVMIYLADGIIAHSTSVVSKSAYSKSVKSAHSGITFDFVNKTNNGVDNYFSEVGQYKTKNGDKYGSRFNRSISIVRMVKNYPRNRYRLSYDTDDDKYIMTKDN